LNAMPSAWLLKHDIRTLDRKILITHHILVLMFLLLDTFRGKVFSNVPP
jgi:hypothetical protein